MSYQYPIVFYPYPYMSQARGEMEEVRLWPDRLEWVKGYRTQNYYYHKLDKIRYVQNLDADGDKLVLITPEEEISFRGFAEVHRAWQIISELSLPHMLARYQRELQRGEERSFLEPIGRVRLWAIAGLCLLLLDLGVVGYIFYQSFFQAKQAWTLAKIIIYLVVFPLGSISLMTPYFFARRGGILISKTGLRGIKQEKEKELLWPEIEEVRNEELGLLIQGQGKKYRLTHNADNYSLFKALINEFTKGKHHG